MTNLLFRYLQSAGWTVSEHANKVVGVNPDPTQAPPYEVSFSPGNELVVLFHSNGLHSEYHDVRMWVDSETLHIRAKVTRMIDLDIPLHRIGKITEWYPNKEVI